MVAKRQMTKPDPKRKLTASPDRAIGVRRAFEVDDALELAEQLECSQLMLVDSDLIVTVRSEEGMIRHMLNVMIGMAGL